MISYIKKEYDKTVILENGKEVLYYNREDYLRKLSKEYFIDIDKYKKYAKQHLPFKNNIPIKIGNNILIFKIKTLNDVYYINYKAIAYIGYGEEMNVLFKDGTFLKFKSTIHIVKTLLKKCELTISYFESLR